MGDRLRETTRDIRAVHPIRTDGSSWALQDHPWEYRMPPRHLYFVWGGVFTDSRWEELEPGAEQSFGPFHDAATAERVWRDEMRRRVDTALHRLFVIEVPRPGGGGTG